MDVTPLVLLFEREGAPSDEIPEELARLYGGGIGFERPRLYANFVSSLDGVVAIEGQEHSGRVLSGRSEADRFVMGLLRAFADVVVIGAGTLRTSRGSLWTPAHAYPVAAGSFADLRRSLGLAREPRLVVLTARGAIDPHHPALEAGAIVLTTSVGAASLRNRLPASSSVVSLGDAPAVSLVDAIDRLRNEGHRTILSEGGPTVIGGLLQLGLLDELFLTLSPLLAGRSTMDGRPGLIDGVDLLPSRSVRGDLTSVRSHGSHLFLRYEIAAETPGYAMRERTR